MCVFQQKKTVTFVSPIPVDSGWIKFNYDHTGYFYVNYEPQMWARFAAQLAVNHKVSSMSFLRALWCLYEDILN